MPYIKQERRIEVSPIIDLMMDLNVKADGDLNYILFAFCKFAVPPSYNNYKNFLGELRQCVVEIERRMLVPYEEEKIAENGEV
jgi:hypothetical protein